MNSFIEYFINPTDRLHSETHRKGRFFIISFFIFLLFCVFAQIWILVTGFGGTEALIANGIMCVIMITAFFVYKKYGRRVLIVNIVSVLGYLSNQSTYEYSGGIYSSDLVNGVVISAWIFLVANKKSGQFWFLLTFLTILFFYVAAELGWKDFKTLAISNPPYYPFMNFGFCCVFLAIIISLYESNKDIYLKELTESKLELETKGKELELRNKDITDSINYAKKIQYAVLPLRETIYRSIPLSFIYYKPKDIVSGDFFWFHETDKDNYILVCADCTGHGVPGAFMTVIGSSLLNQIVIEDKIHTPAQILTELDRRIVMTLKQEKEKTITVQDGMDLSMISVNKVRKEIIITGAKRPVAFLRDKQLTEYKGSKFSLGGMRADEKTFNEIKLNYVEDDVLYFYTDGYTDQFGGEKGKKFSSKRLKESFLSIHAMPVQEQHEKLDAQMKNWMGSLEQVDDMLVIGIKF